jgi:hypothetical protein
MLREVSLALREVRNGISAGDLLDAGHVETLMQRIRESVADMPKVDVQALYGEVNETIALVSERQEFIVKELHQIRESRKALKGYDHIRRHQTEQKLSRTA